ncbi:MAG TPA: nickel pincer cofactor biosynthesis protein LarC [Gemmataceae bacterium]|nr:nickel pincer cofactor biosynthesis protein LarC [Gemmataceae bacterium]
MRTLHFDCFSGISGDMTLAALLDAGVDAGAVCDGLASLGLPIRVDVAKVRKGGFAATQVTIDAPEEHVHRHLPDVEEILARGRLTSSQRELALRIFRRLAEAEAAAHGMPLEKVHFHEVGALDSIADIAGVAIALDLLGARHISSRSVPTGSGMVKCAHGMMPIPAPGTAALLQGVPLAPSPIKTELTTPTGAAILTTVVQEWIEQPVMTVERIGHGAGQRDFLEQPNLLRVFVGEIKESASAERDRVWMLETNLDDVPAEVIGYCFDQLFSAGALDVFSTPIQMKKNRPGVLLSVLAPERALPVLEAILFRETETFGIRRYAVERSKLQREAVTVETPWGPIRGKRGWREGGACVFTPEYEDCARVARERGIALREVYAVVRQAHGERGASAP